MEKLTSSRGAGRCPKVVGCGAEGKEVSWGAENRYAVALTDEGEPICVGAVAATGRQAADGGNACQHGAKQSRLPWPRKRLMKEPRRIRVDDSLCASATSALDGTLAHVCLCVFLSATNVAQLLIWNGDTCDDCTCDVSAQGLYAFLQWRRHATGCSTLPSLPPLGSDMMSESALRR